MSEKTETFLGPASRPRPREVSLSANIRPGISNHQKHLVPPITRSHRDSRVCVLPVCADLTFRNFGSAIHRWLLRSITLRSVTGYGQVSVFVIDVYEQ